MTEAISGPAVKIKKPNIHGDRKSSASRFCLRARWRGETVGAKVLLGTELVVMFCSIAVECSISSFQRRRESSVSAY
jgi:hypothetical protein